MRDAACVTGAKRVRGAACVMGARCAKGRAGAKGRPTAAAALAMAFAAAVVAGGGMSRELLAQDPRQVDPSPAERAIAVGRLDVAEALLYDAVARAPRQPAARGALGAFLASRGKFLPGATLLDEALYFGADSATVEARLLEIYRWTGEYGRLAALQHAPLSAERRECYARTGTTQAGGAAQATVPLRPNDELGIGRITITIAGVTLDADVQPTMSGIELPSSVEVRSAIEPTGVRGDTTFGVARTLRIGDVTLGPVPVALVPHPRVARLGLDVLSLLTPTFDTRNGTFTVRAQPYKPAGELLPLMLTFPGVSFVAGDATAPVALHEPAGRAALRGTRWTLDVTGGAIVIER